MSFAVEAQRRLSKSLSKLPYSVLRAIAGETMRSPDGLELDLHMQAVLRLSNLSGQSEWSRFGLHGARKVMDAQCQIMQPRPEHPVRTHDEVIRRPSGGVIRARVYRDPAATGTLPVVVFLHGGGFVLGSLLSHDGECRKIALEAGAMVIAVDYRLAPEHPFPAAADDAVAAYLWAVDNVSSLGGDPSRMAVAGDSAGGNLAAVVACDLRDHPRGPVFQCLVYPSTDMTRSMPSHEYFKSGYFLTKRSIDWFLESYLPKGTDLRTPRASPLFTPSLAGVAPAYVMTAGFDALRDEGRAYAEALQAAGVRTEYRCHEGLVHGFFSMSEGVPGARVALDEIIAALRAGLGVA